MHEASLAKALLDLALKHAEGRRILVLNVGVGALSGVVTDSLDLYLEFLTEGTLVEGAEVRYQHVPVRMQCKDCGVAKSLDEWRELPGNEVVYLSLQQGCVACGSKDLKIVGGYEFQLLDIEVDDRDPVVDEAETASKRVEEANDGSRA